MAIIYNNKVYRNLEEQVRKNKNDIEELKNQGPSGELEPRVEALESGLTETNENLNETNEALNNVKNNVQVHSLSPNIKVGFEDWDIVTSEVTITVGGALLIAINEISASSDNGTTIVNNSKNIAEAGITVLSQTEDGKITLKCENMPSEDLYFDVLSIRPLIVEV